MKSRNGQMDCMVGFVGFLLIQGWMFAVCGRVGAIDIKYYRERVSEMFYHAYNNYINKAFPYDELRPLSCDGIDTWGSFSLTLIDALDTLAVLGNYTEFRRVAQVLIDNANFDSNINVSVFETNIRVVGGLLSAHLLSRRTGLSLEPGWPCSGPLLRLAEDAARRLLPAFDTETGMPYGTVNLRYGVPSGETPVTCTAGVTTYILEFGTLSRLTGDPVFENTATRALYAMWEARSDIGLVGNHIDVQTGKWTAVDAGIGAGVDSYYEYLVKGAILFQKPEFMEMFQEYRKVIERYMQRNDWYMWVTMQKGQVTLPIFQSLEAFWPGLLSLVGEIDPAVKTLHNYHQVWKQYGFTPEFYSIPQSEVNSNREGYPLRPELAESIMYLYYATKDPLILQMGVDILESIQHSARTPCGYATIKDVRDHRLEDRMESFFLAETTKYLYLLFDPDNFIHQDGARGDVIHTAAGECVVDVGGYIFNTEAHVIDVSMVYCCSAHKKEDDEILQHFTENVDIMSVYGLTDKHFLEPLKDIRRLKENDPYLMMPLSPKKSIDDSDIETKSTVSPTSIQGDGVASDKISQSEDSVVVSSLGTNGEPTKGGVIGPISQSEGTVFLLANGKPEQFASSQSQKSVSSSPVSADLKNADSPIIVTAEKSLQENNINKIKPESSKTEESSTIPKSDGDKNVPTTRIADEQNHETNSQESGDNVITNTQTFPETISELPKYPSEKYTNVGASQPYKDKVTSGGKEDSSSFLNANDVEFTNVNSVDSKTMDSSPQTESQQTHSSITVTTRNEFDTSWREDLKGSGQISYKPVDKKIGEKPSLTPPRAEIIKLDMQGLTVEELRQQMKNGYAKLNEDNSELRETGKAVLQTKPTVALAKPSLKDLLGEHEQGNLEEFDTFFTFSINPILNSMNQAMRDLLALSKPDPSTLQTSKYKSTPAKPVSEPKPKSRPKFKADYSVLFCPAQPFTQRLSIMGEMFKVK